MMVQRVTGINFPIFSLRSKKSLGCGEFLDLIALLDWCEKVGFKLLQVLPIHDTTNSSPYSVFSFFSLHPLYIHLPALLEDKHLPTLTKSHNATFFNYKKVVFLKQKYLRQAFLQRGEKDLASEEFRLFFQNNQRHLEAYAAFYVLAKKYQTAVFWNWEKFFPYHQDQVEELCKNCQQASYYYFVQYHLHLQLLQVRAYAQEKKIMLKGDFPFGSPSTGVEAWRFFKYFCFEREIGAPPDYYNRLGQNWQFPAYDFEKMEKDGFAFFQERLKWLATYFDAVRLDHVLGYFRLWEIPQKELRGLMGSFYPAKGYTKQELLRKFSLDINQLYQPSPLSEKQVFYSSLPLKKKNRLYTQIEDGLFLKRDKQYHPLIDLLHTPSYKKLDSVLQKKVGQVFKEYYERRQEKIWGKRGARVLSFMQKATSMQLFAEDIGVVPNCVPRVLAKLNIPSLHLARIPKKKGVQFEDPKTFPIDCVAVPSNHDTATLRQWWQEDPLSAADYYHTILHHRKNPPKSLTAKLAKEIITAYLASKAIVALFLLQDIFAMKRGLYAKDAKKERINNPGSKRIGWKWRMPFSIERLLLEKPFNQQLLQMIKRSKR